MDNTLAVHFVSIFYPTTLHCVATNKNLFSNGLDKYVRRVLKDKLVINRLCQQYALYPVDDFEEFFQQWCRKRLFTGPDLEEQLQAYKLVPLTVCLHRAAKYGQFKFVETVLTRERLWCSSRHIGAVCFGCADERKARQYAKNLEHNKEIYYMIVNVGISSQTYKRNIRNGLKAIDCGDFEKAWHILKDKHVGVSAVKTIHYRLDFGLSNLPIKLQQCFIDDYCKPSCPVKTAYKLQKLGLDISDLTLWIPYVGDVEMCKSLIHKVTKWTDKLPDCLNYVLGLTKELPKYSDCKSQYQKTMYSELAMQHPEFDIKAVADDIENIPYNPLLIRFLYEQDIYDLDVLLRICHHDMLMTQYLLS